MEEKLNGDHDGRRLLRNKGLPKRQQGCAQICGRLLGQIQLGDDVQHVCCTISAALQQRLDDLGRPNHTHPRLLRLDMATGST